MPGRLNPIRSAPQAPPPIIQDEDQDKATDIPTMERLSKMQAEMEEELEAMNESRPRRWQSKDTASESEDEDEEVVSVVSAPAPVEAPPSVRREQVKRNADSTISSSRSTTPTSSSNDRPNRAEVNQSPESDGGNPPSYQAVVQGIPERGADKPGPTSKSTQQHTQASNKGSEPNPQRATPTTSGLNGANSTSNKTPGSPPSRLVARLMNRKRLTTGNKGGTRDKDSDIEEHVPPLASGDASISTPMSPSPLSSSHSSSTHVNGGTTTDNQSVKPFPPSESRASGIPRRPTHHAVVPPIATESTETGMHNSSGGPGSFHSQRTGGGGGGGSRTTTSTPQPSASSFGPSSANRPQLWYTSSGSSNRNESTSTASQIPNPPSSSSSSSSSTSSSSSSSSSSLASPVPRSVPDPLAPSPFTEIANQRNNERRKPSAAHSTAGAAAAATLAASLSKRSDVSSSTSPKAARKSIISSSSSTKTPQTSQSSTGMSASFNTTASPRLQPHGSSSRNTTVTQRSLQEQKKRLDELEKELSSELQRLRAANAEMAAATSINHNNNNSGGGYPKDQPTQRNESNDADIGKSLDDYTRSRGYGDGTNSNASGSGSNMGGSSHHTSIAEKGSLSDPVDIYKNAAAVGSQMGVPEAPLSLGLDPLFVGGAFPSPALQARALLLLQRERDVVRRETALSAAETLLQRDSTRLLKRAIAVIVCAREVKREQELLMRLGILNEQGELIQTTDVKGQNILLDKINTNVDSPLGEQGASPQDEKGQGQQDAMTIGDNNIIAYHNNPSNNSGGGLILNTSTAQEDSAVINRLVAGATQEDVVEADAWLLRLCENEGDLNAAARELDRLLERRGLLRIRATARTGGELVESPTSPTPQSIPQQQQCHRGSEISAILPASSYPVGPKNSEIIALAGRLEQEVAQARTLQVQLSALRCEVRANTEYERLRSHMWLATVQREGEATTREVEWRESLLTSHIAKLEQLLKAEVVKRVETARHTHKLANTALVARSIAYQLKDSLLFTSTTSSSHNSNSLSLSRAVSDDRHHSHSLSSAKTSSPLPALVGDIPSTGKPSKPSTGVVGGGPIKKGGGSYAASHGTNAVSSSSATTTSDPPSERRNSRRESLDGSILISSNSRPLNSSHISPVDEAKLAACRGLVDALISTVASLDVDATTALQVAGPNIPALASQIEPSRTPLPLALVAASSTSTTTPPIDSAVLVDGTIPGSNGDLTVTTTPDDGDVSSGSSQASSVVPSTNSIIPYESFAPRPASRTPVEDYAISLIPPAPTLPLFHSRVLDHTTSWAAPSGVLADLIVGSATDSSSLDERMYNSTSTITFTGNTEVSTLDKDSVTSQSAAPLPLATKILMNEAVSVLDIVDHNHQQFHLGPRPELTASANLLTTQPPILSPQAAHLADTPARHQHSLSPLPLPTVAPTPGPYHNNPTTQHPIHYNNSTLPQPNNVPSSFSDLARVDSFSVSVTPPPPFPKKLTTMPSVNNTDSSNVSSRAPADLFPLNVNAVDVSDSDTPTPPSAREPVRQLRPSASNPSHTGSSSSSSSSSGSSTKPKVRGGQATPAPDDLSLPSLRRKNTQSSSSSKQQQQSFPGDGGAGLSRQLSLKERSGGMPAPDSKKTGATGRKVGGPPPGLIERHSRKTRRDDDSSQTARGNNNNTSAQPTTGRARAPPLSSSAGQGAVNLNVPAATTTVKVGRHTRSASKATHIDDFQFTSSGNWSLKNGR